MSDLELDFWPIKLFDVKEFLILIWACFRKVYLAIPQVVKTARHFAESGTPEQRKSMLGWIYQRFQERPNERWPWQVHAVFAARHVLHDNALAETYAAALRTQVTDPAAPSWVAQMDFLLRADLGEAEDARAILAGLIDAGQIRSPGELKFLESRIAAAQPPLPNL